MIAFICLFFPAVLCVAMYERIKKCELSRKNWLYNFVGNTVAINLACFLVKHFLLDTAGLAMYTLEADMTPNTAWKYLVMAIVFAVLFAFLEVLASEHIKVTVEENKNEK